MFHSIFQRLRRSLFWGPLTASLLATVLASPAIAAAVEPPAIRDVYTVLFVIDGCNADYFEELMAAGRLPNIHRYMVESGAHYTNAQTVFPSATTTGYQPFVSGLYPGHAGIPYLEWFNRKNKHSTEYLSTDGYRKLSDDFLDLSATLSTHAQENLSCHTFDEPSIDSLATTIFDRLRGHPTAAIYSLFTRNASYSAPKLPLAGIWSIFVSHRTHQVDQYAIHRLISLFKQPPKEIPRFSMVGLLGTDIIGHHDGAKSAMVGYNLENVDRLFGEFVSLLQERNLFDKTYIIISSDHGMHDVDHFFPIEHELTNLGVDIQTNNPKDTTYALHVSARGIGAAHIYLNKDNWHQRPNVDDWRRVPTQTKPIDLIDYLRHHDGTDLLAIRHTPNQIYLFSRDGEATIDSMWVNNDWFYRYTLLTPQHDPLHDMVKSPFLNNLQWRHATSSHGVPSEVPLLSQIFHDGRAGDLFIIAKPNWTFRTVKTATHGTLLPDDMRVPLLVRGPTITPATISEPHQTVDVHASILSWFGLSQPYPRDGASLDHTEATATPIPAMMAEMSAFLWQYPPLIKIIDRDTLRRQFFNRFPSAKTLLPNLRHYQAELVASRRRLIDLSQSATATKDTQIVITTQHDRIDGDILTLDDLIQLIEGR